MFLDNQPILKLLICGKEYWEINKSTKTLELVGELVCKNCKVMANDAFFVFYEDGKIHHYLAKKDFVFQGESANATFHMTPDREIQIQIAKNGNWMSVSVDNYQSKVVYKVCGTE